MKKLIYSLLSILIFTTFIFAQEKNEMAKYAQDETNAQVPSLDKFHKIIVPIWHKYWPKKDYEGLKNAVPEIEKYVADIYKSELPGILREKNEKWAIAKDTLKVFVANYKMAAENNDTTLLLKAAERLHWQYEMMLRIVRPKLKELDAFHIVLYSIYHYYLPNYNLDSLNIAIPKLAEKRDSLMAVKRVFPLPPERYKKKEMYEQAKKNYDTKTEKFYAVRVELSETVDEVVKALETKDKEKISKAIEAMHSKYQKCENVFE